MDLSRDFKPFEQFLADRRFNNEMRNSAITFTDRISGEKVRLDNHAAKERYPELSFLFNEFDLLYNSYNNDEKALAVLDDIESCLVKAEEDFMKETETYDSDNEMQKVVKEWFNGRLDESFYYAEYNNKLFQTFIEEQIDKSKDNTMLALEDKNKKTTELRDEDEFNYYRDVDYFQ